MIQYVLTSVRLCEITHRVDKNDARERKGLNQLWISSLYTMVNGEERNKRSAHLIGRIITIAAYICTVIGQAQTNQQH